MASDATFSCPKMPLSKGSMCGSPQVYCRWFESFAAWSLGAAFSFGRSKQGFKPTSHASKPAKKGNLNLGIQNTCGRNGTSDLHQLSRHLGSRRGMHAPAAHIFHIYKMNITSMYIYICWFSATIGGHVWPGPASPGPILVRRGVRECGLRFSFLTATVAGITAGTLELS